MSLSIFKEPTQDFNRGNSDKKTMMKLPKYFPFGPRESNSWVAHHAWHILISPLKPWLAFTFSRWKRWKVDKQRLKPEQQFPLWICYSCGHLICNSPVCLACPGNCNSQQCGSSGKPWCTCHLQRGDYQPFFPVMLGRDCTLALNKPPCCSMHDSLVMDLVMHLASEHICLHIPLSRSDSPERKDGMKVARKKLMPPTELSTNAWLRYLLSFHVLISLPQLPVPTLY